MTAEKITSLVIPRHTKLALSRLSPSICVTLWHTTGPAFRSDTYTMISTGVTHTCQRVLRLMCDGTLSGSMEYHDRVALLILQRKETAFLENINELSFLGPLGGRVLRQQRSRKVIPK